MTTQPPILVVGLTAQGAEGLPPTLVDRILHADLLVGGQRQLGYFPTFAGERLQFTNQMTPVMDRLEQARAAGQQVVVLASGDPLFYGLGSSLRRNFSAEALEVIPAPSSTQLAFAALGEPWQGAALLSAHARPLEAVVAGVLAAPKAAILTDNAHTPAVIARTLVAAGMSPQSRCAVCESLGGAAQRVQRSTLGEVNAVKHGSLNVFVVWRDEDELVIPTSVPAGLPDDAFSTSAAQITKREVRLLALAELALQPGEVLWDIGTGSGAVSIEAARAQPLATVYAIEKRAAMIEHLEENVRRFPAPNIHWQQGRAPEGLSDWPDPNAVFIGGSGGQLGALLDIVQARLQPGGRLVVNLATLENLSVVRERVPEARINQIQVNRGAPILDMVRLEAQNPIFMVTWQKPK